MPVLTRCRGKTPEGEAMKASPNPKKLKQAARRLKEAEKKAETQKNTGKAKKKEKVDTGKAKKEEKVDTGKAKKEEKVEPTLKTPSPKPILKKAMRWGSCMAGIVWNRLFMLSIRFSIQYQHQKHFQYI